MIDVTDSVFADHDVATLAGHVRRGELRATDLVTLALRNIAASNSTLTAFVAVDGERALTAAAELDARIARGDDPGPLAGMPLGVKDAENAAGFRTTSGSAVLASGPVAGTDSPLVARLKAAGCIVVGKTNMPEFGLKPTTDNREFGVTRNPWDVARTAGGSSGGSAAAVAAGMVPLATGSDGGGSIRIPSAVCGLPGLKPTPGRVPSSDLSAPGWPNLSSKGVLAARVSDIALVLQAVRGPHPLDQRSVPADGDDWVAAGRLARPLKAAWCPTLGFAEVDTEIETVCRKLVDDLADTGCEITEIPVVFKRDPGPVIGTLVGAYMWRSIERYRGTPAWNLLDPAVVMTAELSRLNSTAAQFVEAMDACHLLSADFAELADGFDVVLSPTTCGQTPIAESLVDAADLVALIQANPGLLGELTSDVVDALLSTLADLPPVNLTMGTINDQPVLDWARLTQAFNLAALPAGTSVAGFSASGMPVGLQIAAHRNDDVTILSALRTLEGLRPRTVAPLVPA